MRKPTSDAYKKTIRAADTPRQMEYRVFKQITALLMPFASETRVTSEFADAVTRNRLLWQRLVADLAHDTNNLPNGLKASLISIGIFMDKACNDALAGHGGISDMIEINRMIMSGLEAHTNAYSSDQLMPRETVMQGSSI